MALATQVQDGLKHDPGEMRTGPLPEPTQPLPKAPPVPLIMRCGGTSATRTTSSTLFLTLNSRQFGVLCWRALMVRLLSIRCYRRLFAAAYSGVGLESLGFQGAANAIAAFEATAFTFLDRPFDRYLAGDNRALGVPARRGAALFFGEDGCAECHNDPLLTDQQFYNLAIPQLGPGKLPETPLDFGRARVTGDRRDLFAFRTPPLRNVTVTGPWMHSDCYTTLESAVRHHLWPIPLLLTYNTSQLPEDLRSSVQVDHATLRAIVASVDSQARRRRPLSPREIHALLTFLNSLTSPSLDSLGDTVPIAAPSGLPVDRIPDG